MVLAARFLALRIPRFKLATNLGSGVVNLTTIHPVQKGAGIEERRREQAQHPGPIRQMERQAPPFDRNTRLAPDIAFGNEDGKGTTTGPTAVAFPVPGTVLGQDPIWLCHPRMIGITGVSGSEQPVPKAKRCPHKRQGFRRTPVRQENFPDRSFQSGWITRFRRRSDGVNGLKRDFLTKQPARPWVSLESTSSPWHHPNPWADRFKLKYIPGSR